jgi:hypothetical protein
MSSQTIKKAPSAGKHKQGNSKQLQIHSSKKPVLKPSLFTWASSYVVSAKEANQIASPKWVIPNLVINSHVVLIPAEPNAGKTTLFFHLSAQMVMDGYNVFYVNSDISGADAKPMIAKAKADRFTFMLPDMKVGLSMETVLSDLQNLANSPNNLDRTVFIFDTLKKMVDVINKSRAKELFKLLRRLSAKGMTIILLAHTNKYPDEDGAPIYEGTGDMRADVDELIYLIPQRHDDGSITITTKPDKVRGAFKPISFNIDHNRNVTLLSQPVNTLMANQASAKKAKDQTTIDSISAAISIGCSTQKDIITHCDSVDSIGERTVKKVLEYYSSHASHQLWTKVKGSKNSFTYSVV